ALLAPQPGHEVLVGPNEPVGLYGEKTGAQVVNHLVGTVGLGGNLGVEAKERLAQPWLYHHLMALAWKLRSRHVLPAGRAHLPTERRPGVWRRSLAHDRRRRAGGPPDGGANHELDGVGFG